MKKHLKPLVLIIALGIVFATYKLFLNEKEKLTYIALGDSVAEGMNSYLQVDYGYTDYIKDYLKRNNRLSFYTKAFAKSGYTTNDLKNDIENNKTQTVDNKKIYLKEILRESDLVTLTIGANNYLKYLNIESTILNIEDNKKQADQIVKEIKELIELIKKYAKKQIIVTGYYNPLPRRKDIKSEIDELIKYFNYELEEICEELEVKYVDIFNIFDNNEDYLPNPLDIHPNKKGYEKISKEIIKNIE